MTETFRDAFGYGNTTNEARRGAMQMASELLSDFQEWRLVDAQYRLAEQPCRWAVYCTVTYEREVNA